MVIPRFAPSQDYCAFSEFSLMVQSKLDAKLAFKTIKLPQSPVTGACNDQNSQIRSDLVVQAHHIDAHI